MYIATEVLGRDSRGFFYFYGTGPEANIKIGNSKENSNILIMLNQRANKKKSRYRSRTHYCVCIASQFIKHSTFFKGTEKSVENQLGIICPLAV